MKPVSSLKIIFIILSFFLDLISYSQLKPDTLRSKRDSSKNDYCPQKDIFDLIWKKKDEKPGSRKLFTAFVLPYVGFTPVTRFQFGVGSTLSWRLGNPDLTNLSAANLSGCVTTRKQVILQVKSNIYTNRNKWFLQGDWRFYVFHLPTYGLGTASGDIVPGVPGFPVNAGQGDDVDEGYPMSFNWLKFHQVFSRKIVNNLYAGFGYHLDHHFSIHDKKLQTDTPNQVVTPHYAYSILNGFNPGFYTASGLSINCVYDTRDNIINPYKGFYANVNYRYNFTWLGSTRYGSQLWAEFRTYVGLSKKYPRHLIAFWFYGNWLISGEIPYLDLQSTGFDQMNSSGRGYDQGRWRGEYFLYSEVEYRFPISRCSQILGGVVFVNATAASSKDMNVPLFRSIRPAGGIGLRIMVSKQDRINLLLDFAIGENSTGAYMQAQEIF